jgi:hypothetical protein
MVVMGAPTKTADPTAVNGINVDDLFALIDDVKREPAKGKTNWHAVTTWRSNTHHLLSMPRWVSQRAQPILRAKEQRSSICRYQKPLAEFAMRIPTANFLIKKRAVRNCRFERFYDFERHVIIHVPSSRHKSDEQFALA